MTSEELKVLREFVNTSLKNLHRPRYSLQSIYEDYRKDEIPDEENLELQRELNYYWDMRFRSTFSEFSKTLKYIQTFLGEDNVD